MLKSYLGSMYSSAMRLNDNNVCDALKRYGPFGRLLDVGCWDGEKTMRYAQAAGARNIEGIEFVAEKADEARTRGITAVSLRADSDPWPYPDHHFDCVTSNQVIEHLSDVDHFLSEATRVLKPGGVLVTSTNNLSSWHNVASLVLGWAPFDLTNSSARAIGIGNPMALHKGEVAANGASWCHKTIFTARWLRDWQELYGMRTVDVLGAGYYPLPAGVGRVFKTHSAFITVVGQKTPA